MTYMSTKGTFYCQQLITTKQLSTVAAGVMLLPLLAVLMMSKPCVDAIVLHCMFAKLPYDCCHPPCSLPLRTVFLRLLKAFITGPPSLKSSCPGAVVQGCKLPRDLVKTAQLLLN
jgi:hypothetical protein